jgi:uncharacterized membrane protein YdbT with pleckstrin-like domain
MIHSAVQISGAVEQERIRKEKAMSNHRQLIAAAHFKPVAGRLATSRLFGSARDYLASEIQEAEIVALMITCRPILKAAVFVLVLIMWMAALAALVWSYGAGRNNPSPTDLVVMTVVTVVPMVAALHLALRHVIHPLRADLAPRPGGA